MNTSAVKRGARLATVVLTCACGTMHHVEVTLVRDGCNEQCFQPEPHDEMEMSFTLPARCGCGAPLNTREHEHDVGDTAYHLFATGEV